MRTPPSCGVTVAMNVTDWPKVKGFSEDASAVVVAPLLTVWVNGSANVLGAKLVSPL